MSNVNTNAFQKQNTKSNVTAWVHITARHYVQRTGSYAYVYKHNISTSFYFLVVVMNDKDGWDVLTLPNFKS